MPWVLAGLTVLFLVGLRKLLFLWGVPVSQRLIALVGGLIGALLFVCGTHRFGRGHMTERLLRPSQLIKIHFWRVLLVAMLFCGLLRGNQWNEVGNEFIILWIFSSVLVAGGDDRFWYAIEKPLTVIFYVAALLVFFYYDTPSPVTTVEGTVQLDFEYMSVRYLGTLGIEFRMLIGSGIFLGIWGVIRPRRDFWRYPQILALFIFTVIEVGIFKFRGAAVVFALTCLSLVLIRPILEYRRRPSRSVILLVLVIASILLFQRTEASQILAQRWFEDKGTAQRTIFGSRNAELSAYLSDMKAEILLGHGLGGFFNAYEVFGTPASIQWGGLHFGLLTFTLKGGILMLGLFLAFLLPGFYVRPKAWYQNPCNLVAALMFPILLFQFVMGPFALVPNSIMIYLPTMMAMARFGRRPELDSPC